MGKNPVAYFERGKKNKRPGSNPPSKRFWGLLWTLTAPGRRKKNSLKNISGMGGGARPKSRPSGPNKAKH